MIKSEKGSVTLIVLTTVLFILALLATNLTYISAKRRAQLEETMILQDTYDADMTATYRQQEELRALK